jgi:TfoX/Sxy family transcriptional regulator of competence genes
MAYDEKLAERIRKLVADRPGITERKMFGGIAFMVNGNMFAGIVKDDLMARVGKDGFEDALSKPHTRPMDFAGRPMNNMVYVAPPGVAGHNLRRWVEQSLQFAESLPPKVK